ncbi:hypothetical protein E5D57_009866 [Metarhizium anisopliae]|nr:hypothetical protein E5D57_009866 [Metarhizium anisopliae]
MRKYSLTKPSLYFGATNPSSHLVLFLNEARRRWITSNDRMKGFPVYIPPAEVRRLCLQLLKQYASGDLPGDLYIRHVVLSVDESGKHSLECFGSSKYLLDCTEEAPGPAYELKGQLELPLCLASQYCQNDVFDWQRNPIPWEKRRVLDPEYLARAINYSSEIAF